MDKNIERDDALILMELRKLGLSQKEALLYLLILDKNEITASQLSLISNVSRPTVYRILEELEKKNLVNKIKKHKKTLFVATSPDTLLGLLKIKKREAEEQEREFLRIISTLQSTYALKTTGCINEFDIKKGFDVFLKDLSNTPTDEIFSIYGKINVISPKILRKTYSKIQKRLPNVTVKELYTNKNKYSEQKKKFIQTKKLSYKLDSFSIIAADRIFIITDHSILTIDHKDTAEIIKSLLSILWNNV